MTGSHLRLMPEQPEQPAPVIPSDIADLIKTQGRTFVKKLASKHARANSVGLDESDFVSLGNSAMMEVAPGYDKALRTRFTTYLFPFVDGAMKDEIRRRRHERKVGGAVAQAIERDRKQFAVTQSDEFDVLHNTPETTRGQLDDNLSELAARFAGTAVVTARALSRQGTVEGVREAKKHALAVETIPEAVAMMEPVLQQLWQIHYEEGRTLMEYAKAVGIGFSTAKLHHQRFKERLREILTKKGCG